MPPILRATDELRTALQQKRFATSPCHLPQHEKQQDDGDGVQKYVGEMMPGRPQSVQLTIEHVRKGRERVPVTGYRVGKSPGDPSNERPAATFAFS